MNVDGRIKLDGNKIKVLRLGQCLSRDMFSLRSQKMGCYLSVSTLKRAELGNKIYYRTAQDIARVLKVSLDDIKLTNQVAPNNVVRSIKINRDSQLQRASSILEKISKTSKASVLFIQGEAGIGKSYFIEEIENFARHNDFISLRLPIYDGVTNRKMLLRDLLREIILLHQKGKEITRKELELFAHSINLEEKHQEALLSIFSLNDSTNKDDKKFYNKLINNETSLVVHFLKNISKPVTLILEDLHWASAEIINTIQVLTKGLIQSSTAIILSSRLINNPLYQFCNSAIFNTPIEQFHLNQLTDKELILIGEKFGALTEHSKKCIQMANGNPLFFMHLLKNFSNSGTQTIPKSLNSLIKQQLSHLYENDKNFIITLSALGHEFNIDDAKSITGFDNYNPVVLIECNFIKHVQHQIFQFNHDLIRQGIYQNLSDKVKRETHESIALFYQDKDQIRYTYHLSRSKQINKALKAIENLAENLYEKQDYCEALNQIDIALSIPGKKNLFKLYTMKGSLLKLLDLPSKATKYLEKALSAANDKNSRKEIYLELTEIYAVNQRFEMSQKYLRKTKSLIQESDNKEFTETVNRYEKYLQKATYSLNANTKKLDYQEPERLKSKIDTFTSKQQHNNTKIIDNKEFKIAFLHSTTGFLKEHEEGVLKSYILALDEINQNGGLLGHSINYEIFDGESNEFVFKEQAENIINDKKITSIFGCSTSSTRKQVKETIENSNSLLVYPFHYEGLESSKKIIYTGPTCNLQALPIIDWLINEMNSKTFYFVGSDYVYPFITNEIVKDSIFDQGCSVVAENYKPVGSTDFRKIISDIKKNMPDTVILTLATLDSNKAFLKLYYEAGLTSSSITLVSLVLSDNDICHIPYEHCIGLYGIFSYFQNSDLYINDNFIQKFKNKFGISERIGGYMESAYVGINIWAKAVQKCQSFEPQKILNAVKGISYYGPGGIAYIDEENHHIWRQIHIAQIESDGEFHIQWSSDQPIAPTPYPLSRTEKEWDNFLSSARIRWDGGWGL